MPAGEGQHHFVAAVFHAVFKGQAPAAVYIFRVGGHQFTAQALGCGMTPEGAYLAAHAAEILPAAMAYGAQYAREQLASSLMGGNRPEENGLSGGGAVKMGSGVGSLSRGEYDRICRMVAKGERISFG